MSQYTRFAFGSSLLLVVACGGGGGGGDSDKGSIAGTISFPQALVISDSEPNDSFDQPEHLGLLAPGDVRVVRGRLGGGDELDGFELRSRVPLEVSADLALSEPGASLPRLWLYDPLTLEARGMREDSAAARSFAFAGALHLVLERSQGDAEYVLTLRARRIESLEAERQVAAAAEEPPFTASVESYATLALAAVPGEVLVLAEPGVDLTGELAQLGLREADRIPGGAVRAELALVPGSAAELARRTVSVAAALALRPGIVYAERNLIRRTTATTPDDTFYPLQWHYPLMQLPAAWDITTGDPGIIVAVIDTGETQHPDIDSRLIAGFDFITDPASAADGDGLDADPTDEGDGNGLAPSSFHGTHVAGTIGAESDNADGVAGVTWAGQIMHLRVLGIGGGTDFDIANAILYAGQQVNNSGQLPAQRAHIVNLSLGGPGANQTVQNAITATRNAGTVIVAAAGNNNSSQPFYPASFNGVISVSAVDLNSQKAPYSNFNPQVDVAAPGGNTSVDLNGDGFADGVLSTLFDDSTLPAQPNFVFYQGTSMACPHVAGLAALILSVAPAASPAQVESILTSTATDLGAAGKDNIFGFGLVNAFAAVQLASGGSSTTPVISLSTLSLNFAANIDTLSALVFNVGGGKLLVNDPTVSTVSGGNWLSAVRIASSSTTTDTAAIQVDVDRTGLADASYQGTVDVTSDGGSAQIQVTLIVQSGNQNPDVDIFVLAVDFDTFDTGGQAIVNPTLALDYKIGKLPPGTYILAAGSDDDNDGFICGAGDVYCGLWPTLSEPALLDVGDSEKLKDVDFAVEDTQGGPAPFDRGSVRGFRILNPRATGP